MAKPTNDDTKSFEEHQFNRLLESYERLGFFLKHPTRIKRCIETEVVSLLWRCAAVFGPSVFAQIGQRVIERERARTGYCIAHETSPPFVNAEPYPMCDDCIREANEGVDDEQDAEVK